MSVLSIQTSIVEKALLDAKHYAIRDPDRDPAQVNGEFLALIQVASSLGLDCYDEIKKSWLEWRELNANVVL